MSAARDQRPKLVSGPTEVWQEVVQFLQLDRDGFNTWFSDTLPRLLAHNVILMYEKRDGTSIGYLPLERNTGEVRDLKVQKNRPRSEAVWELVSTMRPEDNPYRKLDGADKQLLGLFGYWMND